MAVAAREAAGAGAGGFGHLSLCKGRRRVLCPGVWLGEVERVVAVAVAVAIVLVCDGGMLVCLDGEGDCACHLAR